MLATQTRVPLWVNNRTRESSVFTVPARNVVILHAIGFEKYATQTEGSFRTEQMACIERVLYEFNAEMWNNYSHRCGWVIDPTRRLSDEISSQSVAINDCEWTLSQCRNLGIIGIPGTYRLRLNDDSAIGVVQVFAELHDINAIAPQCTGAFFQ